MNRVVWALLGVLSAAFAPHPGQAQDAVNVGIVLPLSGSSADYVKHYLIAPSIMAAKEINEQGGLLGKPVKIWTEDSRNDPTSAVSALRKLIDVNHVIAVITAYTPLALPQIPIAEDSHVILLAPSAEHPDITKSDWTVRMTATADKAGFGVAQLAADLGYKTAVTLSEDNEAIRLTDRAFRAQFEKRGGKVLVGETYKRDDTDLRGQLAKFKNVNPDIAFIEASNGRPLALAFRQIQETGLHVRQIFASNSVEQADVRALSPELTNGIIYTTLRLDPEFAARFKRETGDEPDANVGKHYDATRFLFECIKKANSLDPAKIRDAMYNYGTYKGVVGSFIFTGSGEPNVIPAAMIMKNGEGVPYTR